MLAAVLRDHAYMPKEAHHFFLPLTDFLQCGWIAWLVWVSRPETDENAPDENADKVDTAGNKVDTDGDKADAGKEGAERAAHALWALRGKSS